MKYLLPLFYGYTQIKRRLIYRKMKSIRKKKGCKFITIKLFNQDFILDLDDMGICTQLLSYNMREKDNVDYFITLLKKNNFEYIIDIGANIGFFVILEAIHSNSSIIAIEPISKNYRILRANVVLNDLNVKTINSAIANKNGYIEMYVKEAGNLCSIKAGSKNEFVNKERVTCTTLSKIFKDNNINGKILIRCDLEGYEYELFKSNVSLLKKLKDIYLVFEFHTTLLNKKQIIDLLELLKELDFELIHLIRDRPDYLNGVPLRFQNMALKAHKSKWGKNAYGKDTRIKSIDDVIAKYDSYDYNPQLYLYKRK